MGVWADGAVSPAMGAGRRAWAAGLGGRHGMEAPAAQGIAAVGISQALSYGTAAFFLMAGSVADTAARGHTERS